MIWTKGTHQSAKYDILQNLSFDMFLLLKYIKFQLRNIEDLCFMTVQIDAKFEEKLICGSENDMRNLADFYQSTWKSQNWDSDGILLPNEANV